MFCIDFENFKAGRVIFICDLAFIIDFLPCENEIEYNYRT